MLTLLLACSVLLCLHQEAIKAFCVEEKLAGDDSWDCPRRLPNRHILLSQSGMMSSRCQNSSQVRPASKRFEEAVPLATD